MAKSKFKVFKKFFNKELKIGQQFTISEVAFKLRILNDTVKKYVLKGEEQGAIEIKRDLEKGRVYEIKKIKDLE